MPSCLVFSLASFKRCSLSCVSSPQYDTLTTLLEGGGKRGGATPLGKGGATPLAVATGLNEAARVQAYEEVSGQLCCQCFCQLCCQCFLSTMLSDLLPTLVPSLLPWLCVALRRDWRLASTKPPGCRRIKRRAVGGVASRCAALRMRFRWRCVHAVACLCVCTSSLRCIAVAVIALPMSLEQPLQACAEARSGKLIPKLIRPMIRRFVLRFVAPLRGDAVLSVLQAEMNDGASSLAHSLSA